MNPLLKNAVVSIQLGLEDFASDDERRIISAARNLYSGVPVFRAHGRVPDHVLSDGAVDSTAKASRARLLSTLIAAPPERGCQFPFEDRVDEGANPSAHPVLKRMLLSAPSCGVGAMRRCSLVHGVETTAAAAAVLGELCFVVIYFVTSITKHMCITDGGSNKSRHSRKAR